MTETTPSNFPDPRTEAIKTTTLGQRFDETAEQWLEKIPKPWNWKKYTANLRRLQSLFIKEVQASVECPPAADRKETIRYHLLVKRFRDDLRQRATGWQQKAEERQEASKNKRWLAGLGVPTANTEESETGKPHPVMEFINKKSEERDNEREQYVREAFEHPAIKRLGQENIDSVLREVTLEELPDGISPNEVRPHFKAFLAEAEKRLFALFTDRTQRTSTERAAILRVLHIHAIQVYEGLQYTGAFQRSLELRILELLEALESRMQREARSGAARKGNAVRRPRVQFPNRAEWLKEQLNKRSWTPRKFEEHGGPDHRITANKLLEGHEVRSDVLERIATALKVLPREIPSN